MWNTRRIIALLSTLLLLAASFTAAFAEGAEPAPQPETETTQPVEDGAEPEAQLEAEPDAHGDDHSPDAVMATVNGVNVTHAQVDEVYESLLYQFSSYGYDTSAADVQNFVHQQALSFAVQIEVITQKAAALGLDTFTDEEMEALNATVEEAWNYYRDLYVQYYGNLPEAPTDEEKEAAYAQADVNLPTMGYTKDSLLENEKQNAILSRVEDMLTKEAVVTEEQIDAKYQELVEADRATYASDVAQYEFMTGYYGNTVYYQPAGMRGVTHILLRVPDETLSAYSDVMARFEEQMEAEASQEQSGEAPTEQAEPTETAGAEPTVPPTPVTQADVDAAKAAVIASVQDKIDEIMGRVEAGETFESLIAAYGEDPGMQVAENLANGYPVHMDSILWDPAFVSGAFSMDSVGDVSQPVVGQNGVHILFYLRDIPEGAITLTDAQREELRETLLNDARGNLFNVGVQAWMAEAVITYPEH